MPTASHLHRGFRAARRHLMAAALLLAASVPGVAAQAPAGGTAPASDAANVFLDCSYHCDENFLRTEITYVNWVRDRTVADVHLLVTTQTTGSAGTEYTLAFIGQRRFANLADTLKHVTPAASTADETRRGLVRVIGLGLARFVARTDARARLNITSAAPAGAAAAAQASPADDPWNHWTFRLNANTNFNGEQSYESRYYYGSVSANRITEAWKITISANESQRISRFVFEEPDGDRTAFESFRLDLGFNTLVVKSLTSHWSAGVRSGITSSTYSNQSSNMSLIPSIEYNVFPYSESTRRQLRLQYGLGGRRLDYRDTTIFGKLQESKPLQAGSIALDMRQTWGSATVSIDGQQYLDSPRNYRLSSFANANVRLFKGFSFNFYGGYERLRDQIYLSAAGATRDEILTRQQQLATGYSYWGGLGLSYTFGSIYSSVVNPRFGGSGGTMIIF